ncbi:MAG: hypothetical protein Q7J57_14865 [Gemmobacter sp.]|nr:hypothetical protein [Gemmobacter sp.]
MLITAGLSVLTLGAGALGWRTWRRGPALPVPRQPVDAAALAATQTILEPPAGPLRCYHLGHSLVGRDMPAMLAQLAGHDYAAQIGWGTPLRAHWESRVPIHGLDTDSPRYRPAREALTQGGYDAVVLTEMVELRDAILWHASPHYLAKWAALARQGNPGVRLYLYETWHRLDDPDGWLTRLDTDLDRHWLAEVMAGALAWDAGGQIHLIPGGQVMAAVTRAAESGAIPGLSRREDLFARMPDGTQDPIHLNDLGNYVIALTHFATLYHRTPEGLPHLLVRADGSAMTPVDPAIAAALQHLVWQVVRAAPHTGVAV